MLEPIQEGVFEDIDAKTMPEPCDGVDEIPVFQQMKDLNGANEQQCQG